MTKEQEEAIERIKYLLFIYKRDDGKGYRASGDVFDTDFEAIDIFFNMLKEKDAIEKKDKRMIDLMAEHIVSSAIVDDTVCAIKCDCETDIEEDCTHEKMLNCTKQYFENKVEAEEE